MTWTIYAHGVPVAAGHADGDDEQTAYDVLSDWAAVTGAPLAGLLLCTDTVEVDGRDW